MFSQFFFDCLDLRKKNCISLLPIGNSTKRNLKKKMSVFSESALEKKLAELSNSQQSVQTLSLWLIHHRKHSKTIVKVWYSELKKGKNTTVFTHHTNISHEKLLVCGLCTLHTITTQLASSLAHNISHSLLFVIRA